MEQHRDHACRIIIDANRLEDVLNVFLMLSALDWVTIVKTIDAFVEMGQLVIQRKALNARTVFVNAEQIPNVLP